MQVDARGVVVVASEADAWALLQEAIAGGGSSTINGVQFSGWPYFEFDVHGRDWHGTVPTRVMQPLLDVQRDINRAYAHAEHIDFNLRRLNAQDRDALEVVLKVKEGSSLFSADISSQLNRVAQAVFGRMTGRQALIAVLGIALLITTPITVKEFLNERAATVHAQAQVELSHEETERLQIMQQALAQHPALETVNADVLATASELLKASRDDDVVTLRGVPLSAADAHTLAQPARERARQFSIAGQFIVIGNKTDLPNGFRVTVRRTSDGLQLKADVPMELAHDAQQAMRDAEWSKSPVEMSIDAESLHDRVVRAVVVSATPVATGPASR